MFKGDWAGFRRLTGLNLRRVRANLSGGRPFIHRRLGFDFCCYPENTDSLELYLGGTIDRLELSLLKIWLEQGDSVIDVGANFGVYAVAAAQAVNRRGKVLAIEASPQLAERITQTAARLGLMTLRVCACCAGEASGSVDFFVADSKAYTAEQSRQVAPERRAGYRKISVPMLSLDQIAAEYLGNTAPAFVKLDIEGAEVLALRGAPLMLRASDPPFWLVEINPPALRRFGASVADLLSSFPEKQFERWLIPQHPRVAGRHLAPRPLNEAERFDDAVYYNLAALPRRGRWAGRVAKVRPMLANT